MTNRKQFGLIALTISIGLFIVDCVGSPIHQSVTYDNVQKKMKKNNKNILKLKIGISQEQVQVLLGEPERSEGYSWGAVWLYRTAMTSGVYGTSDSDMTPVVFNENGKLEGWGRNFYKDYIARYEIKIKQE